MGFTSKAIHTDSMVLSLSGGEKQGVAIGRALYFEADLIILDEPTMGLSLSETRKVIDFVRHIKEQGKSAIFISHKYLRCLSGCRQICDPGQGKHRRRFPEERYFSGRIG